MYCPCCIGNGLSLGVIPYWPLSRYPSTAGSCLTNTLPSKLNWRKINSEYRSIWNPKRNTVPCASMCTVFLITPLTVSGMHFRHRKIGVISTSLLLNIKACTFRKVSGQWLLTLYSGRKYYQPPKDAYKLDFRFTIGAIQPEYLDIALTAQNGPLLTTDHRIRLEAVPLDAGRTFIHFGYDYSYGALARSGHERLLRNDRPR